VEKRVLHDFVSHDLQLPGTSFGDNNRACYHAREDAYLSECCCYGQGLSRQIRKRDGCGVGFQHPLPAVVAFFLSVSYQHLYACITPDNPGMLIDRAIHRMLLPASQQQISCKT
jgi:hypothetical protein